MKGDLEIEIVVIGSPVEETYNVSCMLNQVLILCTSIPYTSPSTKDAAVELIDKLIRLELDLVFLMIWTVILGNLVGTILGMLVANPLARVTFLRGSLLVPVLLSVILTGSFVVHSSWFDMIVALVFGLLGYVMKNLDYSRPAFIIGFVLGLMVERNLFLSVKLYGNTFFLQPLALGLMAVTILVLVYNVHRLLRRR